MDEALDSLSLRSNVWPMGDRAGLFQAARNHPVISGGAAVFGAVALFLQILDSPTVSRVMGFQSDAAEVGQVSTDEPPLSVSSSQAAPGQLAIRDDMRPPSTGSGQGPKSITLSTDGNSAQRNLVAAILSSVRRDIASEARAHTDTRVAIVLDQLSFGSSSRTASFSYAIEGPTTSGQCVATITFGTNAELSSTLARRVAQTIKDSMKQGELACA